MQKRGGYHDFSFKFFFVSEYRKIMLENTSVYRKISGIEKFYASERGGITFLRRKLLSHSTKKFRWGTVRCFRKFRVLQNFMHKKGISLNSVEKFLSHSADKIRRRTLLFRKNSGIENFQAKEGGASRFCQNFLSHRTETKSFVKEPLFSRKFLVSKKNYG